MKQNEVQDFAKYEVFESVENAYHCICICEDLDTACYIAKLLALKDPNGDSYYVTSITIPHTMVVGGGWHYEFWKDKNGKLQQSTLM